MAWGAPGVVLDGSFGASGALPGPNFLITAGMGRQVGSNLFHSFSDFNLTSAQSATFTGPAQIQNIIARVTGGSPSSIDGAINSNIAGANLFLLNPSGVMFGPHAQVNVSGAFTVGTPDYVKLADGGKFNTSLGGADNLTSAPVSAFGFLAARPAAVQMTGTALAVNPNEGLHVLAGDVTLNATELDAPSGNLTLFSAASPGEVPFSLATAGSGYAAATNSAFGTISFLNGSYVDIDGAGGGNLVLRGGNVTVDDSELSSFNEGTLPGGKISVQAGHLAVQDGGVIASSAASTGPAGDVSVQAASVTVDGTEAPGGETAILSFTYEDATGPAGSVNVTATGAVSLLNGGQISTSTAAPGGNIAVQADSLDIDGSGGNGQFTGLSDRTDATAPGPVGLLSVKVAHALNVTGGAEIFGYTSSGGQGPEVEVQAGSLDIDTLGSPNFTGVESEAGAAGAGGLLKVAVTGPLTLNDGGEVASLTFGSGTGGDIQVNAGSVAINGSESSNFVTGIQSTSAGLGNGGSVAVDATGAVTLSNLGLIASATFEAGASGNVSVQANSLSMDGEANISTYSEPDEVPNPGQVGSVTVSVNQALVLQSGAVITTYTNSAGNAGAITVNAGSVTLGDTSSSPLFSGISDQTEPGATGNAGRVTVNVAHALNILNGGGITSNTFSSGHGSDVAVNAGSLYINGSDSTGELIGISSNTDTGATGDGGSLLVRVTGAATITGGGEISSTTFSSGNSGFLTLEVGGALTILDGGEVTGGTFSSGASGGILVHAGSLYASSEGAESVLTGLSDQSGVGATGNGGSLTIDVDGSAVLADGAEIASGTHSAGNGGNVTLRAGSLTIEGPLTSHLTGISSETDGQNAQGISVGPGGKAGSVDVDVSGALTITAGQIDTNTYGFGDAGDVTIHAGTLSVNGAANPNSLTGIYSNSSGFVGDATDVGGNAGTVSVNVTNALSLTALGKIGAATFTSGLGGNIEIQAGSVTIDGVRTGITAQALGPGNSGSITVSANKVALSDDAVITTSSLHSDGGSIVVNASELTLKGESGILTAAALNGGNITLQVGGLVYLLDSGITAAAVHNGGNILIDPEFVVLNDSVISADASLGGGGNITIVSNFFFDTDSLITATGSTTDGTITITAPNFDLANNLLILPGDLVQAEKELRERCARSLNHEFSSLIVVGRGGVETPPDELQPDFGIDPLAEPPDSAP